MVYDLACSEPDADLISNTCCRGADKEEIQGVVQVSRRFLERCEEKRQDEYAHVIRRGEGGSACERGHMSHR